MMIYPVYDMGCGVNKLYNKNEIKGFSISHNHRRLWDFKFFFNLYTNICTKQM